MKNYGDVSDNIIIVAYIIIHRRSCIDGVTSVALRRMTDDKERERSRNCGLSDGAVGEWRSTLFLYFKFKDNV